MKVNIKTWEAMEKEFGLDRNGYICCRYTFTKKMENGLPEDRIVDTEGEWYLGYAISDDMIDSGKKKAPAKREFVRNVSYTMNGYEYDPVKAQEFIDGLIAKRAADLIELNDARNNMKAFKRKYKEA